jgi:hypothetical protein
MVVRDLCVVSLVGWMRGRIAVAALVCGLSIALAGCEGSAAGGPCDTIREVASKITSLTDDLSKAQNLGKIDAMTAGDISAKIMAAGSKFETDGDQRGYCTALDQIRQDAKL